VLDNYQRVEAVLAALPGEIVVVTDADDRETRAICSSGLAVHPEKYASSSETPRHRLRRLSSDEARRLHLDPSGGEPTRRRTAFTVTVDVRHG